MPDAVGQVILLLHGSNTDEGFVSIEHQPATVLPFEQLAFSIGPNQARSSHHGSEDVGRLEVLDRQVADVVHQAHFREQGVAHARCHGGDHIHGGVEGIWCTAVTESILSNARQQGHLPALEVFADGGTTAGKGNTPTTSVEL